MKEDHVHNAEIVWSDRIAVFENAFIGCWDQLYFQAYRKTQSVELSKDLVQESFIVLWNNLPNLQGPQEILPFLYGTLRKKVLTQYRKSEVHLKFLTTSVDLSSQFDLPPDTLLLDKELNAVIGTEVSKMPDRMREIYLLKRGDGLSIREIAEKLGISEQTVKNQLQNAYGRLRSSLNDYNSPLAAFGILLFSLNSR
jgi:RNA polymerase sigma factor (sigma-70 family)